MGFADQLKKARLNMGFTQQQVADAMGITNSTYCGYETGKRKPDVEKIKRLAKILNTSGDILLETEYKIELFSPENAILHVHMTEDSQFTDLYKIWIHLNDTGKQKLMDNANDLVQIYKNI